MSEEPLRDGGRRERALDAAGSVRRRGRRPTESTRTSGPGSGRLSLLLRVFLLNAVVFMVGVFALAASPATVSSPISLREAAVLVAGLTAIVVLNLLILRRAFAPLTRLIELMQSAEPLRPGRRVPVYGDDMEVIRLTRAFNDMLDRLERERRESVRLSLAAQEGERQRVAQELHDEVGQTLTAVVLQLDRLARSAPDDLRPELGEARETARVSLEDVRAVAHRLRPEALDDLGLRDALAALCRRIEEQSGIRISRRLDATLPRLTPEADLVIYRVAQEALTNTLRHAEASQATVSLVVHEGSVVLRVTDDGRGLKGAAAGGGIKGMRERALLVGGRLEVHSLATGGAEVLLELDEESTLR